MYTVIIQETETSQTETRYDVPSGHAHKLGTCKMFYKVQLVNEFGIIDFEYKA